MLQVRPATHAAPEPPYNHHITPPAPSAPAPRERKPKQAKVEKPTSDHGLVHCLVDLCFFADRWREIRLHQKRRRTGQAAATADRAGWTQ